jgi:hypothetical protein
LLLLGCGGSGGAVAPPASPAAFQAQVAHRYFPLIPGTTWIYEGEEDGAPREDVVRTSEERRLVLGVSCTQVEQEVSLAGLPSERTLEWYAEDRAGNVWKFGEESLHFDGVEFRRTDDSWIAGEEGARAWLALPATPRVGQRFTGGPAGGEDVLEVYSIRETIAVAAGTFKDCLLLLENPDDVEDEDIILYGDGVGVLSTRFPGGRIDLVSIERR